MNTSKSRKPLLLRTKVRAGGVKNNHNTRMAR
jgi:hypothetical protein